MVYVITFQTDVARERFFDRAHKDLGLLPTTRDPFALVYTGIPFHVVRELEGCVEQTVELLPE